MQASPAPHPHSPEVAALARPSQLGAWLQVVASLLWLPQAAVIAWSIAAIQQQRSFDDLLVAAALFVLLGALRAALDALGLRRAFAAARHYTQQLRLRALQSLAQHSPVDMHRPSAGRAASVINEQADQVTPYRARYTTARLRVSTVPLVILVCVTWWSWVAGLVLLVAAPLIPLFMALVGWRAEAVSKKHLQEVGNLNQFLLDRLQGLASIRGLGAVGRVADQLAQAAEQLRSNTMAVLKIAFLSSAVLELFSALGVALVAVYVGFHLLGQLPFGSWGGQLSLGQAMFVLLLAPAFFEPLRELSAVWHDKAAGVAAEEALQALQQDGPRLPGAAVPQSQTTPSNHAGARIQVQDLAFAYDGASEPVLQAMQLDIAPGEKVALWGESGSGKSSLMALLAGLAAPSQGSIHINNIQLDDTNAAQLRRRMSWVSQKPHLFAASLASNIHLGRDVPATMLQAAIQHAALQDVVAQRGNAVIGDGGMGLSGGEALRLTLARAGVNPHCQLILADEPTAHLDGETAQLVRNGLHQLASQGATLIVATHDPLLAAQMDRVVSLDGTQPTACAAPAGEEGGLA